MTIQSWWLLKKLKKAQKFKDACWGIDEDKMIVKTLYAAPEDTREVCVKFYSNSLDSTLDYLERCKYIEHDGRGVGQVLHAGWHWGQITLGKIVSFLFRSIAVPVVVAFLTSLVTIWLTGVSQSP